MRLLLLALLAATLTLSLPMSADDADYPTLDGAIQYGCTANGQEGWFISTAFVRYFDGREWRKVIAGGESAGEAGKYCLDWMKEMEKRKPRERRK